MFIVYRKLQVWTVADAPAYFCANSKSHILTFSLESVLQMGI